MDNPSPPDNGSAHPTTDPAAGPPIHRDAPRKAIIGTSIYSLSTPRDNASLFNPTGTIIAQVLESEQALTRESDFDFRLLHWQPGLNTPQLPINRTMKHLSTPSLLLILGMAVLAGCQHPSAINETSRRQAYEGTFSRSEAAPLPGLMTGGFAATPAFEDDFSPGWDTGQTKWEVATWLQNKTQMDPSRACTNDSGYLRETVLAGEPYRGGSIQSIGEFGWGRWVARVKPSSVPGVLNSIFTDDWDDKTTPDNKNDGHKGEIDIELLSYTFGPNSGQVHLAIHLEFIHPAFEMDIPLDFNPSADFHDWGIDVLPDRVVWHVDGRILQTWHYKKDEAIDPGYEFFFNSWTRPNWIKGPPDQDAVYLVDWVKFYPLQASR